MNTLVRQLAVLSVMWAVCEMLLPDGKQQQMVRMTASLLIMTALLTTVRGWLGQPQTAQPAMTIRIQRSAEDMYLTTALTAVANQLENWCVNFSQRAGYQAKAAVWLSLDGGVDHIDLSLLSSQTAVIPADELQQMMAGQLGVEINRIRLWVEEE